MVKHKAVFLDKDGTLIPDIPFNTDPAKIELSNGAAAGLHLLAQHGYLIIVVSNQSGIARGYFALADLEGVSERLRQLVNDCGATLTACYFCPHSPEGVVEEFTCECDCRKPRSGLLLKAARDWDIDLSSSWMIGDILNDVEAGKRAGCKTILVDNGGETEWIMNEFRNPDHITADLHEAAMIVAKLSETENADDEKRMAAL